MTIGYLTTLILVGVPTLLALWPVRRPATLAELTFLVNLAINEVPHLALVLLAPATVMTALDGDLGVSGWAAAGLIVAGLVVIAARGRRSAHALPRALDDGLGAGWRAAVAPDLAAALGRRPPYLRILAMPFRLRPRAVVKVRNISYGEAGRRNLLDVYHHRSRPAGAPVLIHLHGGKYRQGRKSTQSMPLVHRLARQGWVVVSANYRLRPAATHPDHLIDAKKMIAWVRRHGHEYGADPGALFVSGSSAGGHMALLAGLTPDDPAYQPGFEDADTTVTAVIVFNGYYGPYFGDGESDDSAPAAHLRPDAPPVLLVHGDRDTIVPVESARSFAARLREVSANAVVYAELPWAQHAFDLFPSLRFEAVVDTVEAFAAWVRSPGGSPGQLDGQCRSHFESGRTPDPNRL
ncbi:alpha/beta hydrolase [Actinomadura montaniterrae]|uniref:Alpha/beta hydrolase n=1 Tax=Actinomadura montaniterrae TaxID=1803903 RepID=A0A6L3W6N2_9ACTN|nr:alpha/beta hydrolase [Actinomadura montaniterrae]KAB2390450.1 alpha/beta hydrolase [Actinomadura montaniterrae]